MPHLITLQLTPPHNTFSYVRGLPGIEHLAVDEAYGLVAISPKRGLYVIRVSGDIDQEALLAVSEVQGGARSSGAGTGYLYGSANTPGNPI